MNVIEILKVLVLGIVEGFTEWLPISSTGHMILVDEIIHLDVSEAYREVFMVVPGLRVGDHVPTRRVGAVGRKYFEGIHGIT